MKRFCMFVLAYFFFFFFTSMPQSNTGSFTVRAGLGTDINLGLGYGAGVGFLFPNSNIELNVVLFGHHSEETTEEYHKYTETTDLFIYGVMANYLIGYPQKQPGIYGIVGFGFSAVNVEWEENSPSDGSLGSPLAGGGSKQSESGTGGGSVINAGFGYSFGNVHLRTEFPVIVSFAAPGDAAAVAPTLMVTLGYSF